VPGSFPLWQAAVAGGVDLVLNGHRHQYERFTTMDAAGAPTAAAGAREIVVGTGGDDLEAFGPVKPTSEARVLAFGVLELQLGSTGYTFRFVGIDGIVLDHGSGTCHATP
jgi:hypothetical protein